MAEPYKMERSVFTRNPLGGKPGESEGLKRMKTNNPGESKGELLSAYPQDNVHGLELPDCHGGEVGGSRTNLSHSLSGASAVQRETGRVKKDI